MKNFLDAVIILSLKFFDALLSHESSLTTSQVISPFSYLHVISLLANGSDKEQYLGCIKKLGFEADIDKFYEHFMKLNNKLNTHKEFNSFLCVKNYLIHRKDFEIKNEFKTSSTERFGLTIFDFDPLVHKEKANEISKKIAADTDNIIKRAFQDLNPDICTLILNIICLKLTWKHKFDSCEMREFHKLPENKTVCKEKESKSSDPEVVLQNFMKQGEKKKYWSLENEDFIAIEMPYKDSSLSFVALMPKNLNNWEIVKKEFCSLEGFKNVFSKMKFQYTDPIFPEFQFESEIDILKSAKLTDINETLNNLAINNMMEGVKKANFKINQKILIDVNENGTLATVATTGTCFDGGPKQWLELEFNQPMLFSIVMKDKSREEILPIIMGNYMGPEKKKELK
ncbi:serpin-type proteinase inhibitor 17 [Vairimorpha necatrix]|uniref:Serpin-type proteinase inhibitor 17 n=1 Tax=Vairimorpha necatrix TaxID=6039 RepID=A0AAX4JCP5_9MICR